MLCSMPAVCRAWAAAVRSAHSRMLEVSYRFGAPADVDQFGTYPTGMRRFASFATWLPKYAGLVRSISINRNEGEEANIWAKYVAEPMLALSLQQAITPCQQEREHPLNPLQLLRYSSDILYGSAVLQALLGTSLRSLELPGVPLSALAAALPRFGGLQALGLDKGQLHRGSEMRRCILEINNLSGLTSLEVGDMSEVGLENLPTQLRQLTLAYRDGVYADLGHLAQLTKLGIVFDDNGLLTRVGFPVNLRELYIRAPAWADYHNTLTELRNLESLTIEDSNDSAEVLLQLGTLTSLQHVALQYMGRRPAERAMTAWSQLRQLHSLVIDYACATHTDFVQVWPHVTSVAGLTRLEVDIVIEGVLGGHEPIGICEDIAHLSNLQELSMAYRLDTPLVNMTQFVPGDAQHLSSLAKLTKLCLDSTRQLVTDATVAVLGMKLRQLQSLAIPAQSAAVLPVIGGLKTLK